MVITEADLFLSAHPSALIRDFSVNQLEAWFGPSERPTENLNEYKTQLLDDLWRKYHRIDLIKWDPVSDVAFFDYSSQKFISLDELNQRFDDYPLLSLRRLNRQLFASYSRWKDAEPFRELIERINQLKNKAMIEYVVDPDYLEY